MDNILLNTELRSLETWRSALAEYVGTLLFVFLGAGSVVASSTWLEPGARDPAQLVAIALAHGLAIAILVYSTANISGGHINPAVTFAATITRVISVSRGSLYVVAQLAGGVTGAFLLMAAIPESMQGGLGAHALAPEVTVGMGLTLEAVLTFVLVFVVFATAMDPKGMGRLAPLAIGLAVLVGHLVAVPLTGASMNPARSFGPALATGAWTNHWAYWVGPLAGAAIAGLLYRWVFMSQSRD